MESGRTRRKTVGPSLVVLAVALLGACSSGDRAAVDGIPVFDADVALVRGERVDSARREFPVESNTTFVVVVFEDDTDIKLVLSHGGAQGVAPATIDVDSYLEGEGIEVGLLDAPRGSRITISLESRQDFGRPGKVRMKLLRYDAEMAADSRVAARLAALRAWTAATGSRLTGEDFRKTAFRDIDQALVHFESAEGDRALAAWGRVVRARLNYRQLTDLEISIADARHAERGFAALGASRNAARARFVQAAALVEIAADETAKNPSAAEAARDSRQILLALSDEPTMSALERARAAHYLGVLEYHLYNLPAAWTQWQPVISAYEALGFRQGRLQILGNLGVIAYELGDFRAAAKYHDQVIEEFDQLGSIAVRSSVLYNAAEIDTNLGNVDRAIERLLRALELTREHKLAQHEGRLMYGLGRAYLARGDTAQAVALLDESLKLRRSVDDPNGLIASLGLNGTVARETGDIKKALALHREAISLAITPNVRVYGLVDLARDYQAALDYQRAIATCREALSVPVDNPDMFSRFGVLLTLAEVLLEQPHRTEQSVREAGMLAEKSLNAAILRADLMKEIAARRLLAQVNAARGSLPEARDEYERAIALIFKYRSTINNPELRATTLAHEQKTFRGYVDLLMRDVAGRGPGKLQQVNAAEEEALRTLEWARALNFDSGRVSQLDAATEARLEDLLAQMAGKRVRIASLLRRDTDVSRELEVLQVDISRLRTEVDQLRAAANRETNIADASTVVDAPWPVIAAGTTQLSYALGTEHAYLWVRDASGIRATVLSATPAAIASDVAKLAAAARGNGAHRLDSVLSRLSTVLLPAGTIGVDSTTLEIVAEGQAAAIPFAALSTEPDVAQRQAERRSIVMIGSLFNARVRPPLVQPHKWSFVALANDSRSSAETPAAQVFPVLPTTNAEARSIAAMFRRLDPAPQVKLLFGADGNASNLKAVWHDGVDAIHFATHGLADLRQPLASSLLLPALDADGTPTYLTAGQVQEWRGDADLVYLSACETAVGPARFAEGLPGLQRAFLRAGARGVIATLWPVEDVYASLFAADFYRRYTTGTPAARALSETQRSWMQPAPGIRESEQAYRRMTAWAHAYYEQ